MSRSREAALQGKTALVTGASSGIGAATALRLARGGMNVVLTARRLEQLERVAAQIDAAGGRARVAPADLAQPEERRGLLARVRREFGAIDVLVNNAGFGWYGYAAEMPLELAAQMLRVNVEAGTHLTLALLPEMRARGSGHIVNVSSIAGNLPSQGVTLYSATKAYLNAFTAGLVRELRGTGVAVTAVLPGPVDTAFFEKAAGHGGRHLGMERFGVTPERVANAIWGALLRPRRDVYVPRGLAIVPWIELAFGGLIDRVGPLLLRWGDRRRLHAKESHAGGH